MDCSMLGTIVHHQLPKLAQTHVHPVGDAIQPSHPFSSCLQSFTASGSFQMSQFFASRWPKYWSFSFSISPSNGYSGLISFWTDWLDLLAVQGTLKSLLQHHSSKASIIQHSAFFIAQLSHPYPTTGKTIALTRWTFVGKVMSLLFTMLFRLVIAFLPRSKSLLISWLQSPSAVSLEPQNIKSLTISIVREIFLQYEKTERYATEPSFFPPLQPLHRQSPHLGLCIPFFSLLTSDSPGWARTLCWKQTLKCWDLDCGHCCVLCGAGIQWWLN